MYFFSFLKQPKGWRSCWWFLRHYNFCLSPFGPRIRCHNWIFENNKYALKELINKCREASQETKRQTFGMIQPFHVPSQRVQANKLYVIYEAWGENTLQPAISAHLRDPDAIKGRHHRYRWDSDPTKRILVSLLKYSTQLLLLLNSKTILFN